MLGEYKDSGFKEPPFLARRADGQVLQLPRLLYLVAASSDGSRSYGQIAEAVSEQFGRGVSEANVQTLVDGKLRPLGVLAARDGSSLKLERPNPLLALNFKTAVIPPALVNAVTTVFRPLFWPLVVVAALAGFLALDWWLFFVHGIAQGELSLLVTRTQAPAIVKVTAEERGTGLPPEQIEQIRRSAEGILRAQAE